MSILDNLAKQLFSKAIDDQVHARLAAAETENSFLVGVRSATESDRDRYSYDRDQVLDQALEAWRVNPLARRIVGFTTQYAVGGGIEPYCKHEETRAFIKAFWNHRLNKMDVRTSELCDELTRSGNLFILLSTDAAGMSYIRAVPARDIEKIESTGNDVDQELQIYPKANLENMQPEAWPVYDEVQDERSEDGSFRTVMLHYAINRPVGAQWGESDLAPLLKWLSRYANWLEDRARLNRYRTTFLYVVKAKFASEAERVARQRALNMNPPSPGSILVTDESEEWSVIAPNLDSQDANTDGLALKKMIASGAGVPLHFLAEPESATRTTAEAAGGPTFRHFEQRQKFFLWVIEDLLRVALKRRGQVDRSIQEDEEIEVKGTDISARDNISLALAATNIVNALGNVRNRGLIDDAELLRLVYRFAGEAVDVEEMLKRGKAAGPVETPGQKKQPGGGGDYVPSVGSGSLNPETGDLKPSASGESD